MRIHRRPDNDDDVDDDECMCESLWKQSREWRETNEENSVAQRRLQNTTVVIIASPGSVWKHGNTACINVQRRPRLDNSSRHNSKHIRQQHQEQSRQYVADDLGRRDRSRRTIPVRPLRPVRMILLLLPLLLKGWDRLHHVCAFIPLISITPNKATSTTSPAIPTLLGVPVVSHHRRFVQRSCQGDLLRVSFSTSSSSSFDSDPSDDDDDDDDGTGLIEDESSMEDVSVVSPVRLDALSSQPSSPIDNRNTMYAYSNTTNKNTPFGLLLQDLNRILTVRHHAIRTDPVLERGRMERRTKPPVMTHDMDGAERCLVLIRHVQRQDAPLLLQPVEVVVQHEQKQQQVTMDDTINNTNASSTTTKTMTLAEAAYQIVMRAFLQRGRLRWHNSTPSMTAASATSISASPSMMDTTIICAADQLEELLAELQSILALSSSSSVDGVSLDTYNLVLKAYAVCATPRGDRHYAGRAQALLDDMRHRATLTTTTTTIASGTRDSRSVTSSSVANTPLVESYLHVLHAFAWQQANLQPASTGADPAFGLLETICNLERDNTDILLQAHIWVLEAYSKSIGGARRCQQLLETVKELNATAMAGINPSTSRRHRPLLDAEVYSNAILAWSKATEEVGSDINAPTLSASPAEMAHALLLELIDLYTAGAFRYQLANATDSSTHQECDIVGSEPPLIAFNGVISAWGRVGRLDKAEEVLWLMEKKLRPQCKNLVPNAVSYNSVLHGILRLLDREAALRKGLDLVSYMENHANEQPAIQPNAFTYQTLMKCWLQSQRPDAAEEAERLLLRIEQLWSSGDESIEPTNRIYNMVLNAYAKKSSGRVASSKALDILRRMKRSSKCQPDIISFTSAIECISNSGDVKAPELAEELFLDATKRYNETKLPDSLPNLRFYTMTIQALAKNNGSVVRARALLTQLVQQYYASGQNPQLRPNTYPYNYVLNCAANTLNMDKMEAFRIASQTYQEMRKSDLVRPDSFSFAFWLKCCNNLLEPGDLRTKGISFAFEECKREGLVNNEVITRLIQGSPLSLVDRLLETTPTETFDNRFDKRSTGKQVMAPRGTGILNKGLSIRATPFNKNSNNNNYVRSLTVRDLPPSWSRNTRDR